MNSILGGIAIFLINLIGATWGFHIGLNFITSVMVRFIRITRSCLFNHCKITNWVRNYKIDNVM